MSIVYLDKPETFTQNVAFSDDSGYKIHPNLVTWCVFDSSGVEVAGFFNPAVKTKTGFSSFWTPSKSGNYSILWKTDDLEFRNNIFVYPKSADKQLQDPPNAAFKSFPSSTSLTQSDLPIYFRDDLGDLVNPVHVVYSVIDSSGKSITGFSSLPAVQFDIGSFYAQYTTPCFTGTYKIRWDFQKDVESPLESSFMTFNVVAPPTRCSFVIIHNSCFGNNRPPTPQPTVETEITGPVNQMHLPFGPLPASGVFTDQDPYILPVGTRRISFFISYQRGFSGGHASFRLFWNNGIEEVQETLIDSVYENVDSAHSNQSMYLQDTSGPTPADDNLIRFIMYVDVPPGIISVRLRASETGYASLPGSCGITITPSLV